MNSTDDTAVSSVIGRDLNLLVGLRVLLEEANVTRAGARLQVGQPAMSAILSRLRAHYGDELLLRVGRDYELTPLAKVLQPKVQHAVALLDRALGVMEEGFDEKSSRRSFEILASDYAGFVMQDRVRRAMRRAPGIRVEIKRMTLRGADGHRDLLDHDLLIAPSQVTYDGRFTPVLRDRFVCLLDPANPALVDGQLSWQDFVRLDHAAVHPSQIDGGGVWERFNELGFVPHARVVVTGIAALPQVIAATDMVSVVPRQFADLLGPLAGVVAVEAPFGVVEFVQHLWWHPARDADPGVRWLIDQLANTREEEQ